MRTLIEPTIVLLLFLTVRSVDLAITHNVVRAIAYSVVALLALIALIVQLHVV